jgi:hypothetical protein
VVAARVGGGIGTTLSWTEVEFAVAMGALSKTEEIEDRRQKQLQIANCKYQIANWPAPWPRTR